MDIHSKILSLCNHQLTYITRIHYTNPYYDFQFDDYRKANLSYLTILLRKINVSVHAKKFAILVWTISILSLNTSIATKHLQILMNLNEQKIVQICITVISKTYIYFVL